MLLIIMPKKIKKINNLIKRKLLINHNLRIYYIALDSLKLVINNYKINLKIIILIKNENNLHSSSCEIL